MIYLRNVHVVARTSLWSFIWISCSLFFNFLKFTLLSAWNLSLSFISLFEIFILETEILIKLQIFSTKSMKVVFEIVFPKPGKLLNRYPWILYCVHSNGSHRPVEFLTCPSPLSCTCLTFQSLHSTNFRRCEQLPPEWGDTSWSQGWSCIAASRWLLYNAARPRKTKGFQIAFLTCMSFFYSVNIMDVYLRECINLFLWWR